MKKTILLFVILCFGLAGAFAQTGSITNVQASQRSDGSGLVDVNFDLSGTGTAYNINMQVSFNAGSTYSPVPAAFLNGNINSISPGNNKHIVWDGVGSFPNTFTSQCKLKIIASSMTNPCPGMPTVTDIQGQVYNTVQIGSQCWMAENLNTGFRISSTTNQSNNGVIEKYCHGNVEENCLSRGGLYQWNELMQYIMTPGVQGICPIGWHVPTDDEWTGLVNYLEGAPVAGGKLKETGLAHWRSPNTGATNSTGFTAIPGGFKLANGAFTSITDDAIYFSSTQMNANYSFYRRLYYNLTNMGRGNGDKMNGYSVRCLKNN